MHQFYYHYDKDTHQAKIVIDGVTHFVDKIICSVYTQTERKETSPRFVVSGICDLAVLDKVNNTMYIS